MAGKSVTFQLFCRSSGDWALASTNISLGEGDISSLKQISTRPPPSKEENLKNSPSLLGGGYLEIRLNEEISPSPSELLVDACTQSPTSDKTNEMLHFY